MDKLNDIFRCNICGHIIEIVRAGQLVCCNQPMELLKENSTDAAKEKHVPVVEKTKEGFKVKIGSVPHPMEEKHYIQWIEVIADGISYKQFLNPGDRVLHKGKVNNCKGILQPARVMEVLTFALVM